MQSNIVALLLCGSLLAGAACSNPEKNYARNMERARSFLKEQKFDEARIELLNAVKIKPASAEAYLLLGRALVAQKNLPGAAKAFSSTLELAPDDLEAALSYAQILLLAKQPAEAEKVLTAGLGRHADDPGLLILMSQAQAGQGKFADAEKYALSAAEKKPEAASSWLNLSRIHMAANHDKAADKALSQAESLAPDDDGVVMTRAGYLQRSGRMGEAVALLQRFIAEHPEHRSPRILLGELFESLGRFEDARNTYEAAIQKKDDAFVQNRLGLMLVSLRDGQGAVAAWEKSARLEPRFPEPRLNLARYHLAKGEMQEAGAQVDEVYRINPEYPGALALRGEILLRERKYPQAAASLEKAVKQAPGEKGWNLALAKAKIGTGDYPGASALLQELQAGAKNGEATLILAKLESWKGSLESSSKYALAISRDPVYGLDAMQVLGDNEFARKRPVKAEVLYRRIIAQRPSHPGARIRLGLSLEAQGKVPEAKRIFQELVGEDKKNIQALGNLVRLLLKEDRAPDAASLLEQIGVSTSPEHSILYGAVQESRGDAQAAEKAYQSVIDRQPQYIPAYSRLVSLFMKEKEPARAEAWLRESLKKQDKNRDRLDVMLGMVQDAQGDRPGAIESYRSALKENPDLVPALNNLAWDLAESGSLDEALLLAMRGRGIDDKDPNLADTYGWILHRQGNSLTAIPILKEAGARAPHNDQIRLHLVEVLEAVGRHEEAARYKKGYPSPVAAGDALP